MVSEKKLKQIYGNCIDNSNKTWIKDIKMNPGALHKALKVPMGKNIPQKKLKIKPSDSTRLQRMKRLALTLESFHK